jgi:hypothetical protein
MTLDADAAARDGAQRYCGWHVTPVKEGDEVTLDGPGGRLLMLPTLALVELTSVIEDGVEVPITDLYVSKAGMVKKKSGGCWSRHFGSIVVTMTHGYASAPNFEAAVASMSQRLSLEAAGGRLRVVGPFQYDDLSRSEQEMLASYRLESRP